MKKTILILAVGPKDTPPIRLSEEVREIQEVFKRAEDRSNFDIQVRWAVRPRDLVRAMTEVKPNIVHFCGHGEIEGIAFEDQRGNAQTLNKEGLASLFESFADRVECVTLNACYSKVQADAIGQHIDYVISMEQEIQDRDAIEFAVTFYDVLGAGGSYEFAYKIGCAAMRLTESPEVLFPLLKTPQQADTTLGNNQDSFDEKKELPPGSQDLCTPLSSGFEHYDRFIDDFCERIDFGDPPEISIHDAIRGLLDADLVYVYNHEADSISYKSKSSRSLADEAAPNKLNTILRQRFPKTLTSNIPHRIYLEKGSFLPTASYLVVIPRQQKNTVLIIWGVSSSLTLLADVAANMLGSLYEYAGSFGRLRTKKDVRDRMYDRLKSQYSYVSDAAYNARFESFRSSLHHDSMQLYFEPILLFDRQEESVTIYGWEALARDPQTQQAPNTLFQIAEQWGVQFQTELDLYVLESAIRTYSTASEQARTLRYDDKKRLFINVYPSSILRSKYAVLLHRLLNEEKWISGKKLILEISEKSLLPSIVSDEEKGLNSFRNIARKYRKNYDISFAVDDFGVGNAAVSRLEHVDPTYVKIDRDILHFEKRLGASIIEYLVGLKFDFGYSTIVEGFDEHSNFSLRELVVDLGVVYLQGHNFGVATPDIRGRLGKELHEKIFEMIGWKRLQKN
ncbi:MAG TPA: EAL domain-containing protein [Caldilineaceae bacterium]|nr:EAL domain-containing protein [Caldilineaceae bacterium]